MRAATSCFYAFFRRQAFDAGGVSLEALRTASDDHMRRMEDALQKQVSAALSHVAQGFLDYRPDNLQPDQRPLKEFYKNPLILATQREGGTSLALSICSSGLFDPQRHPFLQHNAVGNPRLHDQLTRTEGLDRDSRDLCERSLGTIYEGLVASHLEARESSHEGWSIALTAEKRECRATGRYYTQDALVRYMAAETLGPVLHRAIAVA